MRTHPGVGYRFSACAPTPQHEPWELAAVVAAAASMLLVVALELLHRL